MKCDYNFWWHSLRRASTPPEMDAMDTLVSELNAGRLKACSANRSCFTALEIVARRWLVM